MPTKDIIENFSIEGLEAHALYNQLIEMAKNMLILKNRTATNTRERTKRIPISRPKIHAINQQSPARTNRRSIIADCKRN